MPQRDPAFHRRTFLGIAAVGVLGLTVAGCGGDDEGTTAPETSAADTPTTGDTPATTSSGATAGDVVAISMKNIQFNPKQASVEVGQKVVWTNDEAVQHDVRALKGATFHSELFGQGGTHEWTPTNAGTLAYDCSGHPGMVGSLTITEA